MKFKKGVKINGIKPEMVVALMVVKAVIGNTAVITSVLDGKHSRTSLHYVGYAIDIRTRNFADDLTAETADEIRAALTDEFDVLVEKDHIHIEFQPKNRR